MITQKRDRLLFVLEMANNHMGSVEHGLRIIREFREAVSGFDFNFGFKLQYRHLDTFIHPAYRQRHDLKFVKRFAETRLKPEEFRRLREEAGSAGFLAICTPFDEASVDLIEEHDFDVIKIGSCSFTDWPLLERIAASKRPVIASAAGVELHDIDRVVSFFEHREQSFSLMHCVGEYPTPEERLQLNQIDLFRQRYPKIDVGFSTHEDPATTVSVQMAIAKGARIFERHVGVATKEWPLNAYSASTTQVRAWLTAARQAVRVSGRVGERAPFPEHELATLRDLRRGVFLRRALAAGARIAPEDIFCAIPTAPGQITANQLSKYSNFFLLTDAAEGAPLMEAAVRTVNIRGRVDEIVQRVRRLLEEARVAVPGQSDFEISHHYGIDRFDEFGGTIITCVNREYCKKLIVMLPGQTHPEQYHTKKEETFMILHGDVTVAIDGVEREFSAGHIVTIERGQRHWFRSRKGTVIEEISSTHFSDDSYYTDAAITANAARKTYLTYWLD